MKKILALTLAAVMTAGMSTVAFAELKDTSVRFDEKSTSNNYIIVDSNDDNKFNTTGEDADNSYVIKAASDGVFTGFAEEDGGKKVAIPLYDANGNKLTDESELKGWRINADWTVGDLDEKPDFDYVRVNGVYQCVISFVLPDSDELKSTDLAGSITIYKSSTDNRNPDSGINKITFGVEYGYTEKPLEGTGSWDDLADAEIVVFKDGDEKLEGEYNLVFGDYFEFEVDVTGQGKLNLKNNQDFNKEFAAMYDYANIDFITFEYEPSFNKIGTAWIYAPEDAFIYEVTADGAKAIKGLEWDEDYEAWTFRTRTLGAYAISDVELDEKTVTEDKDDTTEDGNKQNPDTGR